jgi:hypothetical protein
MIRGAKLKDGQPYNSVFTSKESIKRAKNAMVKYYGEIPRNINFIHVEINDIPTGFTPDVVSEGWYCDEESAAQPATCTWTPSPVKDLISKEEDI